MLAAIEQQQASLNEFIDLHFPSKTFNGRIILGSRKPYAAPYQIKAISINNLKEEIEKVKFVHQDYYITANSFSGVSRNSDSLFALHNIVIDIDSHAEQANKQEIFELVNYFKGTVFNKDILEPNTIVFTGRGLQLWWSIEPMAAQKCLFMYNHIKEEFVSSINNALTNINSKFKVDAGASSNSVGYFRMPGSYNTMSKNYGTFSISHNQIINIKTMYSSKKKKQSSQDVQKTTKKNDNCFLFSNPFTLGLKRCEQLFKLRQLRQAMKGEEERNNYCFVIYNSLISVYPHEVAYQKTENFNKGFTYPLSQGQLNSVISTAKRKEGYKLSNAWIIKQLNITAEEQSIIKMKEFKGKYEPFKAVPNQNRDTEVKERKKNRDKKIIKLAKSGLKQIEIAQEIGCCTKTIREVLKRQYFKKREIKKRIHILSKHLKASQIAVTLKLSIRTVQRIIKEYSLIKAAKQAFKRVYKSVSCFNTKKFKKEMRQKGKKSFYICFDLLSNVPP